MGDFVVRSAWRRENTATYDGVPDLVRKVSGGILQEVVFELRAKEIPVTIGKRFLGRMWRGEHSPFGMISGLSRILVNPGNRLETPTEAHWRHLLF